MDVAPSRGPQRVGKGYIAMPPGGGHPRHQNTRSPCAGSRWPAEARGSRVPEPSALSPHPWEHRRARHCRARPSSPTHAASAPCSRSWRQSTRPQTSARRARLRDPEPFAPRGRGPPERTCWSSCLSWLHLLRSWSLRSTRSGSKSHSDGLSRRLVLGALAAVPTLPGLLDATAAEAEAEMPLASWNDGPAKQAILDFVRVTTDPSSKDFVPPQQRIAEFDQDGTLWVEHPVFTQLVFCLDHVPDLVRARPELKYREPFKTVLSGNREAIAKLSTRELFEILIATQSGMDVEAFREISRKWLAEAKHPRWDRLYTELVYQPMIEVLQYLRANGYRTFIATGGSAGFVREYAEKVYGIG